MKQPKLNIAKIGQISSTNIPCRCGAVGMLQEWVEDNGINGVSRYAMVFCQECNAKSKIHSERTYRETRQEAIFDWVEMNRKRK